VGQEIVPHISERSAFDHSPTSAEVKNESVSLSNADIERLARNVSNVPILLQKSLAAFVNGDSVAVMRFAVEAIDDGAAQWRPSIDPVLMIRMLVVGYA
jgi:hypothetical protein